MCLSNQVYSLEASTGPTGSSNIPLHFTSDYFKTFIKKKICIFKCIMWTFNTLQMTNALSWLLIDLSTCYKFGIASIYTCKYTNKYNFVLLIGTFVPIAPHYKIWFCVYKIWKSLDYRRITGMLKKYQSYWHHSNKIAPWKENSF